MQIQLRAKTPADAPWITERLTAAFGAVVVVSRGRRLNPLTLPGLVAHDDTGTAHGLLTYRIEGDACEVVTINSFNEGMGVGTTLLDATRDVAVEAGCRRLWLITTNDNTHVLRYYQKRGFRLAALHRHAVDEARENLKPEIPKTGFDGIPIRDEIELEIVLVRHET